MSPVEFLKTAQELCDKTVCTAADARTAISRSYYAAFLCARDFLANQLAVKVRSTELGEHQSIQRLLINCQVAEAAALGHLLANLHGRRKMADYDLDNTTVDDVKLAAFVIDQARSALDELAKCETPQLRPRIAAGISQYRRLVQGS